MLIPARRAGAVPESVGRIILLTVAAALLVSAIVLPVSGIVGLATRDAAKTFNTLPVGQLGAAPERSVIYDSSGSVIAYLYPYNVYRVPVQLTQISPVMRQAIVAIEDSSFYTQGAMDPRGTIRALLHNSGGSGLQGASTIAQQYVKNVRVLQAGNNQAAVDAAIYPGVQRKVQDLRLAADVEHELTQDQLLDSYLNVAYFNNHAWGIEVASEVYFSEHASQLTLPQAALLAGIVQSPTEYNPVSEKAAATTRRNTVLMRMAQLHDITKAQATAAENTPIVLHQSSAPLATGCTSPSAAPDAFFCDYVQHVLEIDYPSVWKQVNNTGGVAIYTTLDETDQQAANRAVNSVEPPNSSLDPGDNADVEVLMQPGTGAVRAIAENRTFGSDTTVPDETSIDYAVNSRYGGTALGVQTGSSSKIFTLVTALEKGDPFGHQISIANPESFGSFASCSGPVPSGYPANKPAHNAEADFKGRKTYMLGEATIESVNTYFLGLEQQVGLCNTVKTAVAMGMTRSDGTSLLQRDKPLHQDPADDDPSFTLGTVPVSPMSMAAAYATVAAGGRYCSPQAITKIEVMSSGKQLPVKPAGCRQAIDPGVAAAANYVLQRVLTNPAGTGYPRTIPGHTAAAKTGTADSGYYAAFAGYTPTLVGYVSVFNPKDPGIPAGEMKNAKACYVDTYGPTCPAQMFGDNAPGATWEETFKHAALGPDTGFPAPPAQFLSQGSGFGAPVAVCATAPSAGPSPNPSSSPAPGCPPAKKKKPTKPGGGSPPVVIPPTPPGGLPPPVIGPPTTAADLVPDPTP